METDPWDDDQDNDACDRVHELRLIVITQDRYERPSGRRSRTGRLYAVSRKGPTY